MLVYNTFFIATKIINTERKIGTALTWGIQSQLPTQCHVIWEEEEREWQEGGGACFIIQILPIHSDTNTSLEQGEINSISATCKMIFFSTR